MSFKYNLRLKVGNNINISKYNYTIITERVCVRDYRSLIIKIKWQFSDKYAGELLLKIE